MRSPVPLDILGERGEMGIGASSPALTLSGSEVVMVQNCRRQKEDKQKTFAWRSI
jgi:hypothetical protein